MYEPQGLPWLRHALSNRRGLVARVLPSSDDGDEWMYGRAAHVRLTDSGDWREDLDLQTHRYMREDVALGLSLLVSIAQWVNVRCPVALGLLELGSAICGEDFRNGPRSFEALGLTQFTPQALQRVLKQGL